MGIAAQINAWGPRWPTFSAANAPAAVAPVTFPFTPLKSRVELFLGNSWVDVTTFVLFSNRIRIKRGREANQRRASASSCELTFLNDDKRFSPRNINGPYYGRLARNTPIRVFLNAGSGDFLRFTGKVPSWQPQLGAHQNDNRVTVSAFGVRNRLERGQPPIKSAQTRYLQAQQTLQYRSLEDDVPNRVEGPPGSADLPDLSQGGVFSDNVTDGPDSSWRIEVDAKFPLDKGGASSYAAALRWNTTVPAFNGISNWMLFDDTTGVGLIYNTAADGVSHLIQSSVNAYDGLWHHYQIDATQSGGNISIVIRQDDVSILSTSIASATLGHATFFLVQDNNPSFGADRMPAVGHVAFYGPIPTSSSSYDAFTSWSGETPAARFHRLCTEEGIDHVVNELYTDDILMGPQGTRTIPELLDDCEDVAEGLIDEAFNGSIRLSTLRSRYNQAIVMRVDASASQVLPPFQPADDDENVRNDWTISRPSGGTAQYEKTSGPLNITEPEVGLQGIGRYSDSASVNLDVDDRLLDVASWRVHRDTVDEPRYPSVSFNLLKSSDLVTQWLRCDIGSRVLIANAPDDVGPNDPDQILEGYTESFDNVSWDVEAYLSPASTYRVGLLSSAAVSVDTPRLDCSASVTLEDLDTTETSIDVACGDSCQWTHSYGDYPITIGAEDMLLTNVGSLASDTPIFVDNASFSSDSTRSITVPLPDGLQGGDVILLFATQLATGGSPSLTAPPGYVELLNVVSTASHISKVFGRIAGSSEAPPTVNANLPYSGYMWANSAAFRNYPIQLQGSATQTNSSSTSWAHPGLSVGANNSLVVIAGLRTNGDNFTMPAGFSSLGSYGYLGSASASTLWGYQIQTSATNVSAGNFTATGSPISAVSYSGLFTIAQAASANQTLTVVRSLNGVVQTHMVGSEVHVTNPIILAR